MNKEELLKEFNEKVEQLRDEFISKLEDDKKEFELTYPEHEETLYYISNASANICDIYFFDNDNLSKTVFEHGLYFKTKEEAKQHLKERKLLFKLHQWAKEKNDGWEPDWSNDDEEKYYITYFEDESIELSWEITWGMINFSKLPYFKTHELVRECIDIFGDEIKEVLC
nr:MAG TPA: hypothetical protein [Caudoviricetes sp.]